MAVRRSSRLKNQEASVATQSDHTDPQPPSTVPLVAPASKHRKRNALDVKPDDEATEHKQKPVKTAKGPTSKRNNNAEAPQARPLSSPNSDKLSSLPPEIFEMIIDNITLPSSIGKLSQTCKRYYSLMAPRLHQRIATAAMFHANIPSLIRALEPHLTIAQKKQLKKQGKYKGQQERYSSHLDEHKVPECASFVRQLIVGACDPGRRHAYIVDAYLEEAFKNLKNLEIVQTFVLTKAMGESLALMKNLQALSLNTLKFKAEAMEPLGAIKNLQHLTVEESDLQKCRDGVVSLIIWNSRSTLKSLVLRQCMMSSSFLGHWEKALPAGKGTTGQSHGLTALKSLTLQRVDFDSRLLGRLESTIDLMGLEELIIVIDKFSRDPSPFFHLLARLAATASQIRLRNLVLNLSGNDRFITGGRLGITESQHCFLSSFDTLTSLELHDYYAYSNGVVGVESSVVQAICSHKNLKKLNISYTSLSECHNIPFFSAGTVSTIINKLPLLEEIEFPLEEKEFTEISQALSHGVNLKSITCYPYNSLLIYPSPPNPGQVIVEGILQAVLSHDYENTNKGNFIWENHSNICRISDRRQDWDVASKFGKGAKGMQKPEKLQSIDGKRDVMYRDVTGARPRWLHVGYDPEHSWVEKVAKDI